MPTKKLITEKSPLDFKYTYPLMDITYGYFKDDTGEETHTCFVRSYIRNQIKGVWYLTKITLRLGNDNIKLSPVEAMVEFTQSILIYSYDYFIFTEGIVNYSNTIKDPNQQPEHTRLNELLDESTKQINN